MTEWKPTEINEGQPVKLSGDNLPTSSYAINLLNLPKPSNYTCYMFGNRPGGSGIAYIPAEGQVPNRFVRWMMYLCFDCLWVKKDT